jgi:hypothetical protein
MKSVTTMCSRTEERTCVMEIGRKSDGVSGTEIFATGRMDADVHWLGTTEDDSNMVIILAIVAAENGAPTFKNQAGILSRPDAVCLKVSSILNICHSMMSSELSELFADTFGAA